MLHKRAKNEVPFFFDEFEFHARVYIILDKLLHGPNQSKYWVGKMFIWGFCKMLRKPQLNFLVNPILSVWFVILSWNFARCLFFSHDVIKKSSCALTTETQTLPGGVGSEVRVCLQGVKQGNKALDRKIRHKLSKGTPFQWFKLRTSSKIRSFSQ